MVFSSETFLFLFLPLFMAGYFLTPTRWRSVGNIVGQLCFLWLVARRFSVALDRHHWVHLLGRPAHRVLSSGVLRACLFDHRFGRLLGRALRL